MEKKNWSHLRLLAQQCQPLLLQRQQCRIPGNGLLPEVSYLTMEVNSKANLSDNSLNLSLGQNRCPSVTTDSTITRRRKSDQSANAFAHNSTSRENLKIKGHPSFTLLVFMHGKFKGEINVSYLVANCESRQERLRSKTQDT